MGLVRGAGGKPDPQAAPPHLLGHQEKAQIQSESLGGRDNPIKLPSPR